MVHIIERPSKLKIKKCKMTCDGRPDGLSKELTWHSLIYLVGAPKSGKTNLMLNMITRHNKFYNKMFDKVYIFSPSLATIKSKKIHSLSDDRKFTHFDPDEFSDIIENRETYVDKDGNERKAERLIIIDDMTREISDKSNLPVLMRAIMNRRHLGLSIWILSQRWNKLPKSVRPSISDIILFNKSRVETDDVYSEFSNLTRSQWKEVLDHVFKKKFDFLRIKADEPEATKYYRNFNPLRLVFDGDDVDIE